MVAGSKSLESALSHDHQRQRTLRSRSSHQIWQLRSESLACATIRARTLRSPDPPELLRELFRIQPQLTRHDRSRNPRTLRKGGVALSGYDAAFRDRQRRDYRVEESMLWSGAGPSSGSWLGATFLQKDTTAQSLHVFLYAYPRDHCAVNNHWNAATVASPNDMAVSRAFTATSVPP
jgi:hypothetical protein